MRRVAYVRRSCTDSRRQRTRRANRLALLLFPWATVAAPDPTGHGRALHRTEQERSNTTVCARPITLAPTGWFVARQCPLQVSARLFALTSWLPTAESVVASCTASPDCSARRSSVPSDLSDVGGCSRCPHPPLARVGTLRETSCGCPPARLGTPSFSTRHIRAAGAGFASTPARCCRSHDDSAPSLAVPARDRLRTPLRRRFERSRTRSSSLHTLW